MVDQQVIQGFEADLIELEEDLKKAESTMRKLKIEN